MQLSLNYNLLKSWKAIALTTFSLILVYQAAVYLHPANAEWIGSDSFSFVNLLRFLFIDQFLIECITVTILFASIRFYVHNLKLTEVQLRTSNLALYELKFLPLFLFAFFLFAPFTLTTRYLLHTLPDLDSAIYFGQYFYSAKLYFTYLPFVLLIGYLIINVNLIKNYNEQLGKTKEDLNLTKTKKKKDRLWATDEFGELFLEVDKILWIERVERKTIAVTSEDKYRLKENISQLEQKLDESQFIRINRGALINLSYLLNYSFWENDKYVVRIKDSDKEFIMSRKRLQQIKHLLLEQRTS